jgi:hypothetical protein
MLSIAEHTFGLPPLKFLSQHNTNRMFFGVAHPQAFPQARRLARLRVAWYRSGGCGRPVAVIWQPKPILGRRLGPRN